MSIFSDKTPMPMDVPARDNLPMIAPSAEKRLSDTPVRTALTNDERRAEWGASYNYDAMDVRSIKRPRFGHDY